MIRLFTSLYLLLLGTALIYLVVAQLILSNDRIQNMSVIDMASDYIGAFHLIEELHQRLDSTEFQQVIDGYPDLSNIPIAILNPEELDLSEQNLAALTPGNVIIGNLDQSILYYRFLDSEQVVRFGPMNTYAPLARVENIFTYSTLFVLALGVFLWVWSLQKKLKRLDRAAIEFGAGNFNLRISEKGKDKVGKLNRSFNQMAERIEKLIKGHKTLTNAVAHELRTPVSRIRFQLDMLHGEADEKQREKFIFGMSDDVEELGELVDELLTFSRFDREEKAQDLRVHSLHDSLNKVLSTRELDSTIDMNYDQSWIESDSSLQTLPFEPKYLERAIGNLVANAQKYAQSKVLISVSRTPVICTITIDDDGPGIPEEHRETIFEPFKRLDTSRTRSTGGYGLGLAIVKQIVQWHGGRIEISQAPLGGARFSFSWPLTKNIEF
jgi:two-component system, OmpR family, sensor histidine kinase RstB